MKTIKIKGTNIEKFIFESTAEWLLFRKEHIGASDTSIILGVSKWKTKDGRIKTPKLLWEEKLGLSELNTDTNATRYGKLMEGPARKVYEKMVGDLFEPTVIKNLDYPYLMASLDGLNITNDRFVEIKNANHEDHELARSGKIPEKYYPQVQQQCLLFGLKEGDYFSFHKDEGVIVSIKKDEKYLESLKRETDKFWGFVKDLKEPPLTKDDHILRNDDWENLAKELWSIQLTRRELVKKEKEKAAELKELSNHQCSMRGEYLYTLTGTIGTVDYKAIPELSGVDLEKYRTPSSRWNLKRI